MVDQPGQARTGDDPVTEIPREEWAAWCERATATFGGRELILHFADAALGDVRLAEGQPFAGIEHDQLGASVAFTIKYGAGVVPVRYVIAEPQEVLQHHDETGRVREVTILDSTGRRTSVSLA